MIRKTPPSPPPATTSGSEPEPAIRSTTVPQPSKPAYVAPTTKAPRFEQKGWGPGLGQDLDAGDVLTVTLGEEHYMPIKYHGFKVGPIAVQVRMREGEGIDDLLLRAHRVLDVMFEAEFDLKRKQFWERVAEAAEKN